MSEPLTLGELQLAKKVLEAKAAALRQTLHELRRTQAGNWQAEFERTQAELIAAATRIGRLDKRIRAVVEGAAGPVKEEEEDHDV